MDLISRLGIFILWALGFLSLPAARSFGRAIGWFLRVTRSTLWRVTERNIALCYPSLSKAQQAQLARASIVHTGQTIAEAGIAWAGDADTLARNQKYIVRVRNQHLFDEAIAAQKGTMLIVPHYGNWEFLNSWLPGRAELLVIYKMAKLPAFERWMLARRERGGIRLMRGNREGVETFIDTYRNGGAVLFAPDQEPSRKSGLWAPFFGIPALTPKLPHCLVQANPAGRAIYCYVKRVPEGFELVFQAAPEAFYDADPLVAATALNEGFEQCVADDPAQYQWDYRRFKRRPEGLPKVYGKVCTEDCLAQQRVGVCPTGSPANGRS